MNGERSSGFTGIFFRYKPSSDQDKQHKYKNFEIGKLFSSYGVTKQGNRNSFLYL